jgi:HAD superfamily hydrolase (TIGR01509 family)
MALPRPPKAVVFDMDGLLIDSETLYCDALTAAARELGEDLPMAVIRRMIGHAWVGSAVVLKEHFGADFDTDRLREMSVARFYESADAEIALKAGVVEILDFLDQVGLPRGVVTSSRRKEVEHHLGAHGLLERFTFILANGEYAAPKPDPAPYLAAAEKLGLPAGEVLALEDSHNGVRAAAGAGMMTIMVPDLLDPTEEMRMLCVRIARDLHEVRGLIEAA